MEGSGPRLSRANSRYGIGPAPSAPVFNGPVRKWKRKWVRSEPNKDYVVVGGGKRSHQQQEPPSLLLCRWTPLSNSGDSWEPSKRKFRYTPVVVLEEKNKEAVKKLNDEATTRKMNQSRTGMRTRIDMPFEKPFVNDNFIEEMKEPSEEQASFENLDLKL